MSLTNHEEHFHNTQVAHLVGICTVAITECELGFKKIKNSEHLPKLQAALLKQVHKHERTSTSIRLYRPSSN